LVGELIVDKVRPADIEQLASRYARSHRQDNRPHTSGRALNNLLLPFSRPVPHDTRPYDIIDIAVHIPVVVGMNDVAHLVALLGVVLRKALPLEVPRARRRRVGYVPLRDVRDERTVREASRGAFAVSRSLDGAFH